MDEQLNSMWSEESENVYDEDTNESTFSELNIDWHEISVKLAQEKAEAQQRSVSAPIVFSAKSSPPSSRGASRGGSSGRKPTRCPVKRARQRNAANQRERKRMRTINDAFVELGARIPHAPNGRKISKVDTLRLAIDYIHQLSAMLNTMPPSTESFLSELEDIKPTHLRCDPQGYTGNTYHAHEQFHSNEQLYFNPALSWPSDTSPPTTHHPLVQQDDGMYDRLWETPSEHVTTFHDSTHAALL